MGSFWFSILLFSLRFKPFLFRFYLFISELPAEDLDIHNETRPKTEDEKMAEAKNVSMLLKEFLQSGG